ncbi:MAG: protein-export membrane protein SecF [Clostridiales bacterium GWF2_36_10]|nr:MAG: protein-export membrane protein SecF [Clostridiales bacterium GWF2_36_10]HAN21965.1 protein translocase subunit SecF [Clostridiales bacterium]
MLKKFHFINNRKITYILLCTFLIIGVASFIISGFNLDIDFSGGTELQLNIGREVNDEVCDKINGIIRDNIGSDYVSSTRPSITDNNMAVIRTGTKDLNIDQQQILNSELATAFPEANFTDSTYNSISPTIGQGLKKTAIISVSVAVLLMLVYIWIRFEVVSGFAAVLCLSHDLFIMFTLYSLLQIPINSTIIAALLTILGYSINATIIVFDRVRENRTKFGNSKSFADTVDLSIHQTLARSVNTTITTLLTIGMVYILGVDAIRNFALPLIVGILAGLFSSVFLSGLLWVQGNKYFKKEAK